jgi:hypothetical protein
MCISHTCPHAHMLTYTQEHILTDDRRDTSRQKSNVIYACGVQKAMLTKSHCVSCRSSFLHCEVQVVPQKKKDGNLFF